MFGFLKGILGGGFNNSGVEEKSFKKLTPAYFYEKKISMSEEDYIKWLRKQYSWYTAYTMPAMEEKGEIPQFMVDGINLIREELKGFGVATMTIEELYLPPK